MPKDKTRFKKTEARSPLPLRAVLLAIISGCFLTVSFPPVSLPFLSWVALVPLFKGIENRSPSQGFKVGLIAGTVHYLSLIYWIVSVLGYYGGLNIFLSLIPYVLLCLYLALYPAFFSLLSVLTVTSRFFILLTGCFWVGLEYIRTIFLTGFPWCLLGYTQFNRLKLIQISDILGVYGVSFLIVTVNALIYCLIFRGPRTDGKKKKNKHLIWETPIIILGLALALFYGHYCFTKDVDGEGQKAANAVVIQGNIDQSLKWDPSFQEETLKTYQRLSRLPYGFEADLIVWPETAVPFFFQDNAELSPKVMALTKESKSGLIFGSPAYKKKNQMIHYYNRAYLISSDVRPMQYYDKVHLVPFGEYVPLKKYLSFINRLVPAAGDFEGGDKAMPMKHRNLSIGALICFEAIFPKISRDHAREGANILVNLTNDAWFGRTSAPYQHLSMAVFRSVENRLPMIRAANTGFSAFIDSRGKILSKGGLFREEVLKGTLTIPNGPTTIYTRFGDVFALSLLGITVIAIISYLRPGRSSGRRL